MNTRPIVLRLGWLVVIGALGWAVYAHHTAQMSDESRAGSELATRAMRTTTERLVARTRRLTAQVNAASAQLAAPGTGGVRQFSTEPPGGLSAQAKVRSQARIRLADQAFCRRFGLSSAAAQKLAELREEFEQRVGDVVVAARDNHVDLGSATLKPLITSEESEFARRMAAEFGPEVARAYTDPKRVQAEGIVGDVAADLCFTDHPLSQQQSDELQAAIEKGPDLAGAWYATRLSSPIMRISVNSTSAPERVDDFASQAAALRQTVAPHLTPEQWSVVENRMLAAELDFRTGAYSYATWRAIRKGQPVPTAFTAPSFGTR